MLENTLKKLESYGGNKGTEWSDDLSSKELGKNIHLSQLIIRSGEIIDAIQVVYKEGYTSKKQQQHGSKGGCKTTLSFDGDEYITKITGRYGGWYGNQSDTFIQALIIHTNRQPQGYPVRGMWDRNPVDRSTKFTIVAPPGYEIIGFYGKTFKFTSSDKSFDEVTLICCLGAYARPIQKDEIELTLEQQEYEKRRQALKNAFYDPAFNAVATEIGGWSENEKKVNDLLHKLKSLFIDPPVAYYDNPWEKQYFINVKDKIEGTCLFNFLQCMPKGAILHIHPTAMGDCKQLIDEAASFVGKYGETYYEYYVYSPSDAPKEPNEPQECQDFFRLLPKQPAPEEPQNCPNLSDILSKKELEKLNKDAEDKRYKPLRSVKTEVVLKKLTLTQDDLEYVGDIWNRFQPIFRRIGTLLKNSFLGKSYFQRAFEYLAKTDNVIHVELRSWWPLKKTEENDPFYKGIIDGFKQAQDNIDESTFSYRVIYAWRRTNEQSTEIIKSVGEYMKNNPRPVVGLDLVGEEDKGNPTNFFVRDIISADADVPNPTFYFHDGESDLPPEYLTRSDSGSGVKQKDKERPVDVYFNNNMLDAYLLNNLKNVTVARVGHGVELFKTPELMNLYNPKESPNKSDDMKRFQPVDSSKSIAIELCPISNQLLKYIDDIREHPGQAYLAAGIPVSLNPDDPAIYGYQGVTHDFWEACVAWNLDLKALKLLCYYSLKYSALDPKSKDNAISRWKDQWDEFINYYYEKSLPN
ncbi:MAG: jacalin-like lectin [Planctomycetota bacterium]|jgi:adenosine deaminase CECR1